MVRKNRTVFFVYLCLRENNTKREQSNVESNSRIRRHPFPPSAAETAVAAAVALRSGTGHSENTVKAYATASRRHVRRPVSRVASAGNLRELGSLSILYARGHPLPPCNRLQGGKPHQGTPLPRILKRRRASVQLGRKAARAAMRGRLFYCPYPVSSSLESPITVLYTNDLVPFSLFSITIWDLVWLYISPLKIILIESNNGVRFVIARKQRALFRRARKNGNRSLS